MPHRCCEICGVPVDAEYFDVSGVLSEEKLPGRGERAVLASYEIHPRYCGALITFAQFTDLYGADNSRIATPGLEWMILRDGQPLFPYHRLEAIINPWGYNNFEFLIRLDESSRVELVIQNRDFDFKTQSVRSVAGRLIGRYWYNAAHGGRQQALAHMSHGL